MTGWRDVLNYEDCFIGGVAIGFSIIAVAISLGPWQPPYQLRSIEAIRDRFGMPAARLVWAVVAVACLIAGLSILTGVRPSYAAPVGSVELLPASDAQRKTQREH